MGNFIEMEKKKKERKQSEEKIQEGPVVVCIAKGERGSKRKDETPSLMVGQSKKIGEDGVLCYPSSPISLHIPFSPI